MDLSAFVRVRPFAYHTTARANLARIAETGELVCARLLFGSNDQRVRERRIANLPVTVGDHLVVLRSQAPLAKGHIAFEAGWDLARLVELLNSFVYFWPGTERGPRPNGVRHFERNVAGGEDLVVLRVPTDELFKLNTAPHVSECNSGAPRMSGGKRCRRGGGTFIDAVVFARPPSKVVELVFRDRVVLPSTTQWSADVSGPWSAAPPDCRDHAPPSRTTGYALDLIMRATR